MCISLKPNLMILNFWLLNTSPLTPISNLMLFNLLIFDDTDTVEDEKPGGEIFAKLELAQPERNVFEIFNSLDGIWENRRHL